MENVAQLKIVCIGGRNCEEFLKTASLNSGLFESLLSQQKILYLKDFLDIDKLKGFITRKNIVVCILSNGKTHRSSLNKVLKTLHSRADRLIIICLESTCRNFVFSLLEKGYADNLIEASGNTYIEFLEAIEGFISVFRNNFIGADIFDIKSFLSLSPFIKGKFTRFTTEIFKNSHKRERFLKHIKTHINNTPGILASFIISPELTFDELAYIFESVKDSLRDSMKIYGEKEFFTFTVVLDETLQRNAGKLAIFWLPNENRKETTSSSVIT